LKQTFLQGGVFLIILISLISCQNNTVTKNVPVNPMTSLPDNQAGEVVRKAIDYVGGWNQWAAKENFSFYKNITQLDSTGQVRKITRQLHQYQLKPNFSARMSWESGGKKYVIINNGKQAWKYENGKELTDDKSKNEAWNSSYGSNYVIAMPFKLTDPGVILTYDGIDTLAENRVVHALKVEYEKGAGSSGGYHTWWYYFDENTYDLVANYLDYGKGHSYTSYQTFTKIGGIRIHELRNSHAANAAKEVGRIKTIYANDNMQFNVPFAPDLFEPISQ